MFVEESAAAMKKVLEKYTDNMTYDLLYLPIQCHLILQPKRHYYNTNTTIDAYANYR